MKKTLGRMVAVMLALALVISSVGLAMAEDSSNGGGSDLKVLAVQVPGVVLVDEAVTITVTDREDGSPVPAASVYALRWPYPGVTDVAGPWYGCEFLGKTDNDGEVVHTFDRAGGVLIVATREGWGPGLARLRVKANWVGKLAIEAPRQAKVNNPVTIGVHERASGNAVAEADVWAAPLPRPIASGEFRARDHAKGLLEELRLGEGGNVTTLLDSRGFYLGRTNGDGNLEHTFGEIGGYLLVTTKTGYAPGWRLIAIVPDKALALEIDPNRPDVGEDVTFTVKSRGAGDPVGGVDLYAVGFPFRDFLPMSGGAMDTDSSSLETLVRENGFYIGTTNESGEYVHVFDEVGGFVIVGIKAGYAPALGFVRVGDWSGLSQFLPRREGLGGEMYGKGPAVEGRRFGGMGMGVLDRLAPRLKGREHGLRGMLWQ